MIGRLVEWLGMRVDHYVIRQADTYPAQWVSGTHPGKCMHVTTTDTLGKARRFEDDGEAALFAAVHGLNHTDWILVAYHKKPGQRGSEVPW